MLQKKTRELTLGAFKSLTPDLWEYLASFFTRTHFQIIQTSSKKLHERIWNDLPLSFAFTKKTTSQALYFLKKANRVVSLKLPAIKVLGDYICSPFPNLLHLSITWCTGSLSALAQLTSLTSLSINHSHNSSLSLPGPNLESLSTLRNLQHLNIFLLFSEQEDLSFLKIFPKLKELSLRGSSSTNDLTPLKSSTLTKLSRPCTPSFTSENLKSFTYYRTLKYLDISGCTKFTGEIEGDASFHFDFPYLEFIDLRETSITSSAINKFTSPNLDSLNLQGTFTNPDFVRKSNLKRFTKLTNLSLCSCTLDYSSIEEFVNLESLKELNLEHTQIDDDCLILVCEKLRNLEKFSFGFNEVSGRGLQSLGLLKKLVSLKGQGIEFGDCGLESLVGCVELVELNLFRSGGITLNGLKNLCGLEKFKYLDVTGQPDLDVDELEVLFGPMVKISSSKIENIWNMK